MLFGLAGPAQAAANSVTITGPTTAQSGTTQTYTLSVTCSGTCGDTTATFPTSAITGDGPTTDFGSWVGAGTCSTLAVSGGQVTVTYANLGSGSTSCNFTISPPEYTTFNGAKITMTPTLTTGAGSVTGTAATLTVTAGHNDSLNKTGPQQVSSGAGFADTLTFYCGANGGYTGDVGLSALTITDVLPPGATYVSYSTPNETLPGTVTFNAATNTLTYSDPTGKSCGNPPLTTVNAIGIQVTMSASNNGTPDAPNTNLCNSATASFTYLDNTPATATSPTVCSKVIPVDWVTSKGSFARTFLNNGQYRFPADPTLYPYTFPGIWDGTTISSEYDINLDISTQASQAGLDYSVQDPMPCLDNFAGGVYSSNPPGTLCQNPAYIPTLIAVQGFTPSTSDVITVRFADGTTQTVAYNPAIAGWAIPTAKPVAQLDFPAFPEEGNNTGNIALRILGYAAPSATTTSLLKNTETANAYQVGSPTPVSAPQTASGRLLLVSANSPSGVVVNPSLGSTNAGGCTENVGLPSDFIEIASAPSAPITIDYLAPVGATAGNGWTGSWRLGGSNNGKNFITASLSPTSTPNYGGSGRTLYEWVIPAGTVTTGGLYQIVPPNPKLTVNLGPGCAGTYDNDTTVGYGQTITSCLTATSAPPPPLNPPANGGLNSNGAGGSNYCGASAPLTVPAVNPAYTVDKVVQGNLDAAPVGGGGIGHVSPTGGTASYTLSFTNTGQSNLTNPVLYDLLPRIGDTEASSTDPRNSKFAVTLTDIGPVPAGVTVYYSQATNPCRPEVLPDSNNPGCVNDWSATAPASLSSVTALKFAYTGTVYVSGSAAGIHGFTIPYTVSTPTTSVGNVAWNSVGTSVFAGDNPMPPAESAYTGLAAQASQPLVTKSANTSTYSKVGDTITYTFTVTNNTAVTLSPVTVTDKFTDAAAGDAAPTVTCQSLSSPAGSCSGTSASLAPNQVATFTATYTVNQADLDHGMITDQATATAQPPTGGALVNSSSPVTVTAVQSPALSLTKSALPTTVSAVGDQVTYSFLVTNTGNVTISNVAIQDTAFSGTGTLSTPSCPSGTLAPSGQETCTATYTVTQADLDAGSITNTAHARGTGAGGQAVNSSDSSAIVSVTQSPALSLVKSADPSAPAAYTAGQLVTYHYLVTNTGNVSVTGVGITENAFTGSGALSAITCPTTTLTPNAQADCTATYTLTQADVDTGSVSNTATANGTGPSGSVSSQPSTVATPETPNPVLTLTKTALPTTVGNVGDEVTYSFLVTNTGNVTISGIDIDESTFSGTGTPPAATCSPTTLAPGQHVMCEATYDVTQADLDAGSITNTATAVGTAPGGAGVTSNPSSAVVTSSAKAALSLVKSADPAGPAAFTAGQQLTYHFLVTNTGNLTVTGVGISEGTFTGSGSLASLSCPTTTLAPNGQVDCTATYTLTQPDIDAGSVANTASATGTSSAGPVVSSPSTVVTSVTANPVLTLTKSAQPTTVSKAGDTVTYSFLVTNTGNVTLTGLAIAEQAFTGTGALGSPTCPTTKLAPGDQTTCTATYSVTQADIDSGTISNTARANAKAPDGSGVTSDDSTAAVSTTQTPALSLVKSAEPAGPAAFSAGQKLTYHYLVTNTGNVTVTGVGISEGTFTGSGTLSSITCPTTTVAPTDQVDCTATYTLTRADIDAGSIANTATAAGIGPGNTPVQSAPSTVTTPANPDPALTLGKSALPTRVSTPGDHVTYSYLVSNTGNVTIDTVAIDETAFSGTGTPPAPSCPNTTLVPGQQVICTASYTVTQADIDAGSVDNTAVATGTAPDKAAVTSNSSKATVTATQSPALSLVKSADVTSVSKAGAPIKYTFLVTNAGNVTISRLAIDESVFSGSGTLGAPTCPRSTLAPGEQATCTVTYAVTQHDIDAGSITNTAEARGTGPTGASVTSPTSSATVNVQAAPALALVKTATPATVTHTGQQIIYRFAIANTGNLTIHAITVKETRFTGSGPLSTISCPATSLAPTQRETCTARYTVTSKDLAAAHISNTAIVTGTAGPTAHVVTVRSDTSTARLVVEAAAHHASGSGGGGALSDTGARVLTLLAAALSLLLAGALILITVRRRRA